MTTSTETATFTARVYIRASAQQIWDAFTKSEWTERYGYRSPLEYDFGAGTYKGFATPEMVATGMPELMIEGEILAAEEPTRLVQTWHALFDADTTAEPAGRLTLELVEREYGATRVTLTHELDGSPLVAALVSGSMPNTGGGWPYVLSDLKTLLETGEPIVASQG